MKNNEIFDSLFQNALDFLNHAIDEMDSHPKYALINFAAGVELVFKARLALIGLIWIAEEPTDATPKRFTQGMLRTVGLELAKKRIESLTNENIDAAAFNKFQKIARHRNRPVHFFHTDMDSKGQREALVGDFCIAWYHLYRLLTGSWGSHFSRYSKPISEFGARLQYLRPFFDAVYERMVKGNTKAKTYTKCPVCNYQSLDAAMNDRYQPAICYVCGYLEPSHKAIQKGEKDFMANCTACGGNQTVT